MERKIDMTFFRNYYNYLKYREKKEFRKKLDFYGIQYNSFWKYMKGTRTPSKPTRVLISMIVGKPAEEFFPGHNDNL